MAERFLERLTWPEVEQAIERGVDAILLPIGTTEQHGPQMPLDTDGFITWTALGRSEMRPRGPGVILPMDMLRVITPSGVVGDATRATGELGERMVAAVVPRMVQVCREMSGKE